MRPLLAACAAAVLATAAAGPAISRMTTPFTVEDLLAHEDFGRVRFSPNARWIVVERQAPWKSAASYDLGHFTAQLLTGLEIHDAQDPLAVRRFSDPGHAAGYLSGPMSPDGHAMVVYRLTRTSLRLGVMTLATGSVRWYDLTPEWPVTGQTVVWRSASEIILIARPLDDNPLSMRVARQAQTRSTALWADAAGGHVSSAVALFSGRDRDARAQALPGRIVRLDVPTGRTVSLTDGEFVDLELSPDGKAAAVIRLGEDVQPSPDEAVLTGTPSRRRRLVLIELESGRTTEPEDVDLLPYQLAWRPDSARLLIAGRHDVDDWRGARFAEVDRTGAVSMLGSPELRPALRINVSQIPYARAAWDGRDPVLLIEGPDGSPLWRRIEGRGRHTDLAAPPDAVLTRDSQGRLLIADGTVWRRLDGEVGGPRAPRLRAADRIADQGGRGAVNADPALTREGTAITDGGCLLELVGEGPGACLGAFQDAETVAAVSPDRRSAILRRRGAGGSSALLLRSQRGEQRLAAINSELETRSWGEVRPLSWTGVDGSTETGWMLLPPGKVPHDLPAVLIIYPGAVYPRPPASILPGDDRLHINPALLAAAGYVVITPSLPLTRGDGQALTDLGARLETILDAAVNTGVVSPDRAAVLGHSYGGLGALTVATQSKRFRAIIASAARADLGSLTQTSPAFALSPKEGAAFNTGAGWAETGQGRMGASLTAAPQRYIAASPLYAADRIVTPTLIIDGDLDHSRGAALFGALYRLNREAALVTYVGEGHVFTSPANIRDLHARILNWLDQWLSATPGPEASLPVLGPDLNDGRRHDAAVPVVPDQPLRREDVVE